jgi:hypothetical protein
MSPARTRLAALAAAAGYGPATLLLIAEATLPRQQPGERLDDAGLAQVTSAVEVLAQCGHSAEAISELVGSYRQRHRDGRWREHFWHAQLRIAALRFNHPRFYGLSPCEADPVRLASFEAGSEPVTPAACSITAEA